jgi:exosortase A-associated hydrolase 2
MNPFFFGSSEQPLFGAYHPPTDARGKNRGVVICNPFGDEAIKAHRALRQLALMIAEARMHVLRFDYFGSGDSSGPGEEGRVERWREDIALAADELKDVSGVAKVSLTGLRLGASLALRSASGRRDVDRVVLWDPVVDGRRYLSDLKRHHDAYLAQEFLPSGPRLEDAGFGPDELMGFPLPPALREGIASVALTNEPVERIRRVSIVASTQDPHYDRLAEHLRAQGADVSLRHVPVGVNWNADEAMESSLVPTEALEAIVEGLTQRKGATSS